MSKILHNAKRITTTAQSRMKKWACDVHEHVGGWVESQPGASIPQPPGWTGIVDLKSCCSVSFDLQSTCPFPFLSELLENSYFNCVTTLLRWKIYFQCILLERTSTRIVPELHSFRNNSFTSTTTLWSQSSVGQSVGVSSGNHTISATTAVSEKNTTHTCLCDLLSHATSCCVHATCCVEMKPDTRKTETTKIKPPKQNETLMYYVLRPLYTLIQPLYSVFRPLQYKNSK